MTSLIKIIGLSLFINGAVQASTLTFTTLNVRWFGLGGTLEGTAINEKRDVELKKFLQDVSHVSDSDVIALQEIVDKDRMIKFFPDHHCLSYDQSEEKHQHVMICVKKPLGFVHDGRDDNYAWEDVANVPLTTRPLRPAVHGMVVDANGSALAHVIAVHLKADVAYTPTRLQQLSVIQKHVREDFNDQLPVVLLGDMNSHLKGATKLIHDDVLLMSNLLGQGSRALSHVANAISTFRSSRETFLLDHVWTSPDVKIGAVTVWPVCQKNATGAQFMNQAFYYKEVSDHCPLTVQIKL